MNPYAEPNELKYVTSEDVKALIQVREVPACPLVERHYKLFSFGFVYWLNFSDSTLSKREKTILTDFRLANYNYRILFRKKKIPMEAVYGELFGVARKLYRSYPIYQKWLIDQSRYKDGFLRYDDKFNRYLVLNTPIAKLNLPKAIAEPIQKANYRSLYEMLLRADLVEWRKLILSDEDFL